MDSIYLHDKYGSPVSWDMWLQIERILDWVVENWKQPDQSIWEVRGGTAALHIFQAPVLGRTRSRSAARGETVAALVRQTLAADA